MNSVKTVIIVSTLGQICVKNSGFVIYRDFLMVIAFLCAVFFFLIVIFLYLVFSYKLTKFVKIRFAGLQCLI